MPVRVAVLAQRISTESSVIHIRTKKPLKAVIFVEATNRIYKFANFFWRWTPFRTFRIDPVNESMVGKLLVRLCARTNTGIVRVPRVFLPEVDLSPSPTIPMQKTSLRFISILSPKWVPTCTIYEHANPALFKKCSIVVTEIVHLMEVLKCNAIYIEVSKDRI